ncbi:hypothetical protein K501DRAFT_266706 [Backusella circina FSU 941]|nr:hypothetical protein K501DRAFT_266706 [Backusella circina FSU 941]
MRGFFIVMDNAPIHIPDMNDPVVLNQGYVPIYLHHYSPELSPIENIWAILKEKVKHNILKDAESLTTEIIESSEAVTLEHIRNIIQYSVNRFDSCWSKVFM